MSHLTLRLVGPLGLILLGLAPIFADDGSLGAHKGKVPLDSSPRSAPFPLETRPASHAGAASPASEFTQADGPSPSARPILMKDFVSEELMKRTLFTGKKTLSPKLSNELLQVPEIGLGVGPHLREFEKLNELALMHSPMATAHAVIAKENLKGPTRFATELFRRRSDLKGLPVRLSPDCALPTERTAAFSFAVDTIRQHLEPENTTRDAMPSWQAYEREILQENEIYAEMKVDLHADLWPARINALMQILGPEPLEYRIGLVQFLGKIPHVEATPAIARLALYSEEAEIRREASIILKSRREKDYDGVLRAALRYPYPQVAERAMDLIARLDRKDLAGELVRLLEESDPRKPIPVNNSKSSKIRELVRIRHSENCLLCHPPIRSDHEPLLAGNLATLRQRHARGWQEPIKGIPLFDRNFSGFYNSSNQISGPAIRFDIVFLKQDFSVTLSTDNGKTKDRFDFVVRERTISESEAAAYEKALATKANFRNPYQRAAITALRELTKQDVAPTAEAWRAVVAEWR